MNTNLSKIAKVISIQLCINILDHINRPKLFFKIGLILDVFFLIVNTFVGKIFILPKIHCCFVKFLSIFSLL